MCHVINALLLISLPIVGTQFSTTKYWLVALVLVFRILWVFLMHVKLMINLPIYNSRWYEIRKKCVNSKHQMYSYIYLIDSDSDSDLQY